MRGQCRLHLYWDPVDTLANFSKSFQIYHKSKLAAIFQFFTHRTIVSVSQNAKGIIDGSVFMVFFNFSFFGDSIRSNAIYPIPRARRVGQSYFSSIFSTIYSFFAVLRIFLTLFSPKLVFDGSVCYNNT